MNLIKNQWIPVIHQDGLSSLAAPWQIVQQQNPITDIIAQRADFQGALYQFLIGLLQTCFAPEDHDEWMDYFESPPDEKTLKKTFSQVETAMNLFSTIGDPAFMQDLTLVDGEKKSISTLLIDAPGGKTIKNNLDFFIKRGIVNGLCPSCTAQALFCMQINAPSGGVGHRVGLRGGGPLTTLIKPETDEQKNLWHILWLNVLPKEKMAPYPEVINHSVFPWLGSTRLSNKMGGATFPEDVNFLQMYWGMPRRFRLQPETVVDGDCSLCGCQSSQISQQTITKNYGTNYEGAWLHPLTPYRLDPKKVPLSIKGKKGGLGYQHWVGLAFQAQANPVVEQVAQIVQDWGDKQQHFDKNQIKLKLWCFGYDMDNMKARCWYDHEMPLVYTDDQQQQNLLSWLVFLVDCANDSIGILRKQIKEARFKRPKDAKGDFSYIDAEFWQRTEREFYRLLIQLADLSSETSHAPEIIYKDWYLMLSTTLYALFDEYCLQNSTGDSDLKKVISARNSMKKLFHSRKSIKNLKKRAQDKKVA